MRQALSTAKHAPTNSILLAKPHIKGAIAVLEHRLYSDDLHVDN